MEHDRLFKELLRTFFAEFIALFFPAVEKYLDKSSIEFLDKEVFTDLTSGQLHEVDLLVKARFTGRQTFFLVHVENQASRQKHFASRMFRYFARLHEKFALPVYPIALLSYDSPHRVEPDRYRVDFPDLNVLDFGFRVVQLNRLNWRDYLRRPNPVAAVLMSKMRFPQKDRPRVMLECLRMMATLKLNPARQKLVHSFMDRYLRLSDAEQKVYNQKVESMGENEREAVMQIVNQWEERAAKRSVHALVMRQLRRKFGELPVRLRGQIEKLPQEKLEELGEAMLDFTGKQEIQAWLKREA